jgi:hypothetical protein
LGDALRGAPADYPNILRVAPVVARLDVDAGFDRGLRLIVAALSPDGT